MQVFFESKQEAPVDSFLDAVQHIGQVISNPFAQMALGSGLFDLNLRYRRNFSKLNGSWRGALISFSTCVRTLRHPRTARLSMHI